MALKYYKESPLAFNLARPILRHDAIQRKVGNVIKRASGTSIAFRTPSTVINSRIPQDILFCIRFSRMA